MGQAGSGAFQGQASNEEDGHDDVGEEGREVYDLAGGLDALHDDQEGDDPGEDQAKQHPPPKVQIQQLIHNIGVKVAER